METRHYLYQPYRVPFVAPPIDPWKKPNQLLMTMIRCRVVQGWRRQQSESIIGDNNDNATSSEVFSSGSSVVPSEYDAIVRLQAEIIEARAKILATVERLIHLKKRSGTRRIRYESIVTPFEEIQK